MIKYSAIILAGGKSSRMGCDKGLILINNKELIRHSIEATENVCDEIIIVSNQKGYDKFGYVVYEDLIKEIGPIGGLFTGLQKTKNELNVVLTCDSPFVTKEIISQLINNSSLDIDVTYLKDSKTIYPLTAIYNKSCLPFIKDMIDNENYKVRNMFSQLKTIAVKLDNEDAQKLININTPQDLNQLQ